MTDRALDRPLALVLWGKTSDGVDDVVVYPGKLTAVAPRARHFIMRSRRSAKGSAPPLNRGVRRKGDRRVNVLFDLGGTLTDPREGIVACIKYALSTLGQAAPSDSELERFSTGAGPV